VSSWSSSSSKRDVRLALMKMEALGVVEVLKRKRNGDVEDDDDETMTGIGTGASYKNSWDVNNDTIDPQSAVSLTKQYYTAIRNTLSSLSPSPYKAITLSEHEQLCAKEQQLQNSTNPEDNNKNKPSRYPNKIPTPTELETYTQTRWDSVLHYLVGTEDDNYENPPGPVIDFLQETGLMQEDPDWKGSGTSSSGGSSSNNNSSHSINSNLRDKDSHRDKIAPLVITSKGYEFMLQEVHIQVWQFILKYVQQQCESQENSEEMRREALLFLICLSYCKVGRGYRASELSKQNKKYMRDFAFFGLLYVCKIGKVMIFFPTRVAVNLVVGGLADSSPLTVNTSTSEQTSLSALSSSAAATRALEVELEAAEPSKNHIALIVQTNFQVAAYTTSSLHMAMLGLFCDVNTLRRLPNVIFFRITRDSVKNAFKLGIEAGQILRWMKMNAHPRLRTGDQPLIPSNVEDQIILWDRERTRVQMQEVYMLQCNGQKEYDAVAQYARDHEAFGWGCEKRRQILIHYDKSELVVAYSRRWRARVAKRQEAIDSGVVY